ncbi:hypothetical protein DSO57_1029552 [Entomophthora muscae]|uniref:Uncharacterized protein n=1 Tax=Entomophthora muscae TaxID=34485 RepID=A0ACC2SQB4_9FUNG|nr:hypothetical protein DSO57_1029552 [Entomophthora muscae]
MAIQAPAQGQTSKEQVNLDLEEVFETIDSPNTQLRDFIGGLQEERSFVRNESENLKFDLDPNIHRLNLDT